MARFPLGFSDGSPMAVVRYVEDVIADRIARIKRLEAQGKGLERAAMKYRNELAGLEDLLVRTKAETEGDA